MNALNLSVARTNGRVARPVVITPIRELTPDDIASLNVERGTKSPTIKNLRERHHALAKLLANGTADGDAALLTGYSISRVSILKADPAFRDLIAFYKGRADAEYVEMHTLMAALGKTSVEDMLEKLEDDPDAFTIPQKLEIAKFAADRTGHGPASQTTNVNIHVGMAERMERARAKTLELEANKELTNADS